MKISMYIQYYFLRINLPAGTGIMKKNISQLVVLGSVYDLHSITGLLTQITYNWD